MERALVTSFWEKKVNLKPKDEALCSCCRLLGLLILIGSFSRR